MPATAVASVFRSYRPNRSRVWGVHTAESSRSAIVAIESGWQMLLDEPSWSRIAERAYLLWEREGRPPGRADAHWLRAESDLRVELRQMLRSPERENQSVQS